MEILYNPYADEMVYDKKWAIVVGINKYQDPEIPTLDLAVSDADTVKTLLHELFGFDKIYTLYDEAATFENLRAMLSDTLQNVGPNDLVVIYMAGHGDQRVDMQGKEVGYIIPHNGTLRPGSKNIYMDFITKESMFSPAKDMLFIMDVCYGGLGIAVTPPISYDEQSKDVDYKNLKDEFAGKARNIISAGGRREQAVDGLFARILKRALRGEADYNRDMYITSTELSLYVKNFVSLEAMNELNYRQNPQFGSLKSDRGELVFRLSEK
jgi:hypothetical protein